MSYKTASRAYCMAKTQLSVLRELYNWELRRTVDSEGNETNDSLGIIQLYQSTEEVFEKTCLKTSLGLYVIDVKDFVFDGLDAVVYDNNACDMGTVYWRMIPIGQLATREFAEKNNYTLTSPSNEYDSNRIIREVDVLKKEKISVYYLSSLFTVEGEDNRVETPSSINLEVVPNWLDDALGHFRGSKTGSVSGQRQWCDRMIKSIPGGRFKVIINNDLPVYIYRLAVVTLGGSYISSWDLNDSQSGSFSFTANADCVVIMDWYYPYSIKSEYTTHTNSKGPTSYDWVVTPGADGTLTYSKTCCYIGDVYTDTDECPVLDALNTYANFLKGTIYSGLNYPKGELLPALLSRNTKCRLNLNTFRDGESTHPVVENIRIYDPCSYELLEVLTESDCTDYCDNEYIWEYTMTRPILVLSSVSSSAGVPLTVDVTIDYTPTVSITDIQGNVGDITQVDANTIELLVKSYGTLKIQYTSLFVSKVSMSNSHRSDLYMPGTVSWTEQLIHSSHGGKSSSYFVRIIADAPACIFSGLDSVDIPHNTTFSGGDNPTVTSVQRYGDINKGYVYTSLNNENNINYTNIPNRFSLNVSVQELSFYSDAGSSSSFNIPNYIFSGCDSLKTFDLNLNNNPPVYFGSYAFYLCPSLKNVDIPNNTKSFGEGCFMYSGIESFTCPPDITAIADKLALSCRNLSSVKLTEATGLLSIGKRAFSSSWTTNSKIDSVFSSLKTVTVPQSVKTIKDYAFSGNYLLDGITTNPVSVTISGSNRFIFNVDSSFKNNMNTIEEGVFSYCTGLRHVILPSSIHTIDTKAFDSCNSILYFNSPGLKIVMNDAFKNTWLEGMKSDGLELVYKPNGNYGNYLYRKPGTTGIFFDAGSKHTVCTYISPKFDDSVFILYKCNTEEKGGIGTGRYRYIIHKDTISISPYAFSGNYDYGNIGCYAGVRLSEDDVPADDKLERIGFGAFYDNNRIMTFSFPKNGITSYLGPYAFYGCDNLSELYNFKLLPITRIEDYTFWGCGSDKYGIGASIDAGYTNLEFYIPDTTEEIGNYAFAKCPQLMTIANLPSCHITKIGGHAFEGSFQNSTWKTKLGTEIALFTTMLVYSLAVGVCFSGYLVGGQLTINAVENLIAGCIGASGGAAGVITSMATTYLSYRHRTAELFFSKVTSIGPAAFKDCTHLGAILLSDLLLIIPDYCFENCKRLHTFLFDSLYNSTTGECTDRMPNITRIGRRAFYNCEKLTVSSMNRLLCKAEVLDFLAFANAKLIPNGDENLVIFPKTIHTLLEQSLLISNGFTCVFLSKTPPENVHTNVFGTTIKSKITMFVPEGSKSSYLQKFTTLSSSNFTEISDTDPFWESLNNVYTL